MKTVLFFISSTRHTCRNRLEGIYRYARGHDWHVQVVERAFHKVDVRRQLDFWRPIGVIAECGSGADELNNDAFGALPVVFFDADRSKRGPGFYVGSDGVSIGRLAAAHLLALKLPNYAYASFRLPLFWDRERREAFVAKVAKAGVNICEQFGLSVPDDISVLGVDNDEEICENTTTTLSSLAPDFTEGGYLAAELLGKVIANPRLKPTVVQFPVTRVVTRQSTRRMACDRRKIAEAVEMIRVRACEGLSVPDHRRAAPHGGDALPRGDGAEHPRGDRRGALCEGVRTSQEPVSVRERHPRPLRFLNRRRLAQGVPPQNRHVHERLAQASVI